VDLPDVLPQGRRLRVFRYLQNGDFAAARKWSPFGPLLVAHCHASGSKRKGSRMPAIPLDAVTDIPAQELEPWRKKPLCANCAFSEIDPDDKKLYCHEDSARAQVIVGERQPVLLGRQKPTPEQQLGVVAIVSYWPDVQPNWSCWKHPDRQPERRRIESAALNK
jgi:hypothetical protein